MASGLPLDLAEKVESWLKARRDDAEPGSVRWYTIDDLLDEYRLYMQTGTPLDGHVCDGGCHPATCPATS